MQRLKICILSIMLISLSMFGLTAVAGTPDGQTPAEEEACDKYQGEGARYGLCVAYCEAQDCSGKPKFYDQSCDRIVDNFVKFSVKKGYVTGPKPKGGRIDCRQTSCSPEDVKYCGAKEVSLQNPDTKECESFCTQSYQGLSQNGKALCEKNTLPKWPKCVIKEEPAEPAAEEPAAEAPAAP